MAPRASFVYNARVEVVTVHRWVWLALLLPLPALAQDLLFVSLAAPANVTEGVNDDYTVMVRNLGSSPVPNTIHVVLRASLDASYFLTDTLICEQDIPGGFGASSTRTFVLTCPWPVATSHTFVVGRVWPLPNVNDDPNFGNNDAFDSVRVNQAASIDLRPTQLTATPSPALEGATLTLGYRADNQGSSTAPASTTELRLSTNTTWDTSDPLLCTDSLPAIAASQSATRSVGGCTLPGSVTAGSYHLLVRTDATGVVGESDESNNTASIPFTVTAPATLPNLRVQSLAGPSGAQAGTSISVTAVVQNAGQAAASATELAVRIGTTSTYSPSRTLLCTIPVPALAAGASSGTLSGACPIASGVPAGSGFLVARVDDALAIAESDEGDNTASSPITVTAPTTPVRTPNLVLRSVGQPPSVRPDQPFDLPYSLENTGDANAAASRTRAWLSADEAWDAADPELCRDDLGAIGAGLTAGPTLEGCRVPLGTAPGPWRVIVVVDDDGVVVESDESDNTLRVDLTVLGPPSDTAARDTGEPPDDDLTDDDPPTDTDAAPTDDVDLPTYQALGCGCTNASGGQGLVSTTILGALLLRRRRKPASGVVPRA